MEEQGLQDPCLVFSEALKIPPPTPDSVINVFQRGKEIYPQKSVDSYVIFFKKLVRMLDNLK